jgi:hypothetical protein
MSYAPDEEHDLHGFENTLELDRPRTVCENLRVAHQHPPNTH